MLFRFRVRDVPRIFTLKLILISTTIVLFFKSSNILQESLTKRRLSELVINKPGNVGSIGFFYSEKTGGNTLRPRVHTFFDYIEDPRIKEDYLMLDIWKQAWYEAGWYPVVLTIEDAQRHPMYRAFEYAFMSAKYPLSAYNKVCYYRWLAMGVSGGGWMSDMDMLPLNLPVEEGHTLPNGGRFTGHDEHVPALMSGSVEEWDRMSKLLLDTYKSSNESILIFSDMMAMLEIREKFNEKAFICYNGGTNKKVIELEHVYNGLHRETPYESSISPPFTFDKQKCEYLADKKAIHFSHGTIAFIHFKRLYALQWVQAWRKLCT